MRLKHLFQRDMHHRGYSINSSDAVSSTLEPSVGGAKHSAVQSKASNSAIISDIGSIGDYILSDFLLGDLDLDVFVKVEGHYIVALQRRVFRAWSHAVEDRTGVLR